MLTILCEAVAGTMSAKTWPAADTLTGHFPEGGHYVAVSPPCGDVLRAKACSDGSGTRGIYGRDNTVLLHRSTLAHNDTSGDGGGLSLDEGFLLMERSTVSGNGAQRGGGIYLQGTGGNDINGVTITENVALEGGGLHTSRHVHFANSILADNAATDGEECFTTNTGVVSFLASYWTFLSPSCNTDQGPGWHTNPSPGLDPLGFNGSSIQAHCPPAGSPVIDAANTNPLVGVAATFLDQYGNAWAGVPVALPDIGACERP